jgi:hypothetical protein
VRPRAWATTCRSSSTRVHLAWVWYLRDYNAVTYGSAAGPDATLPEGGILFIDRANVGSLQLDPAQYDSGQPFRLRWWFPEDYRVLTRGNLFEVLFSPNTWDTWRDYYVSRTPPAPLGSLDGIAYFPRDYTTAVGGPAYEQPPEEPVAGPTARS